MLDSRIPAHNASVLLSVTSGLTRPILCTVMSAVEQEEVLDPLLPGARSVAHRDSSKFSLRSNVTITVPLWFVFVVCFAVLMMVLLGLGFLYAVVLAEPAVVTIGEILSHSDVLVKSMVASSVHAIANGNELVRFASFACTNLSTPFLIISLLMSFFFADFLTKNAA